MRYDGKEPRKTMSISEKILKTESRGDWAGTVEERVEELSGIQSILDPETKTMTLSSIRHFVL